MSTAFSTVSWGNGFWGKLSSSCVSQSSYWVKHILSNMLKLVKWINKIPCSSWNGRLLKTLQTETLWLNILTSCIQSCTKCNKTSQIKVPHLEFYFTKCRNTAAFIHIQLRELSLLLMRILCNKNTPLEVKILYPNTLL